MQIKFESLDVGERFYDSSTAEDFVKVCGNAAELLTGGNYHTGTLVTFHPIEIVEVTQ
jgi:hypothetical protein